MTETYITATLIVSAIWAIICRIRHMDPAKTRMTVFMQHVSLGVGLFSALLFPPPYSKISLVAGICAFLVLGSSRWRNGAPDWTQKDEFKDTWPADDIDIAPQHYVHIVGGKQ